MARMRDATALEALLVDVESPYVERKSSANDGEKIRQAICAFANDLPGGRQPGYLFVGADDAGRPTGLTIDDRLLLMLSSIRSDGNILPLPLMTVEKVSLRGTPVAVVEVLPSEAPPVRFKGQVWVRVGPRRDVASIEEERRLTERGVASALTFDRRPCLPSSLDDIDLDAFRRDYLPRVIDAEVLRQNQRTVEVQLASLRLFDTRRGLPTHAGILAFGKDPLQFLPGAYIQFARYDGHTRAAPVSDHKDVRGSLPAQLQRLDDLVSAQIRVARSPGHGFVHEDHPDYPQAAIREIVLNAVMHRTYEGTSAPVRIHWFNDHVEVTSPGGLYGHVTPENFGQVNDYRNPVIAEVMKSLGYVERFGSGIARVRDALARNGNPLAEFALDPTHVVVRVRVRAPAPAPLPTA
jgi:ATP-dependent DNA helicase RecG